MRKNRHTNASQVDVVRVLAWCLPNDGLFDRPELDTLALMFFIVEDEAGGLSQTANKVEPLRVRYEVIYLPKRGKRIFEVKQKSAGLQRLKNVAIL